MNSSDSKSFIVHDDIHGDDDVDDEEDEGDVVDLANAKGFE